MTNIEIRHRENMSTLLLVDGHKIASVCDPTYEPLLTNAALLREQLDIAVFILENLPGVRIDTLGMRRILQTSKTETGDD